MKTVKRPKHAHDHNLEAKVPRTEGGTNACPHTRMLAWTDG